jgi:hypothetical protein
LVETKDVQERPSFASSDTKTALTSDPPFASFRVFRELISGGKGWSLRLDLLYNDKDDVTEIQVKIPIQEAGIALARRSAFGVRRSQLVICGPEMVPSMHRVRLIAVSRHLLREIR